MRSAISSKVARMVRTWVKALRVEKPTKEAIKKLLDETLTPSDERDLQGEDILLPMVLRSSPMTSGKS